MIPSLLMLVLMELPAGTDACDSAAALLSPARFVECARAGTGGYRDRAVAIRDGYRRIGRDFPGMGEHWIRIALLFDGKIDASRPEVLNYVEVDGTPTLAGVAYALPLLDGETVPAGPAGPLAWHDHFRTLDEETTLPHHHAHGSANRGSRLAMMHAWVWSDNPDGMFAADNWIIPFLRGGLSPPSEFPPAAAKALSLATGGLDYVLASVEAAGVTDLPHRQTLRVILDEAAGNVAAIVGAVRGRRLAPSELSRLAEVWTDMWTAIDNALPAAARERLVSLSVR